MYPYFLFAAIHHLKSSPTFSVRPGSSVGRVTEYLIRRSWVRFPPRSKDVFFASCGSLFPFTRPLLGPDYMSRAGPVSRDLGMFVKRNKNKLRDYMTTGPAHTEAARLVWVCRDLGMSVKRNKNQLRDYMTTGPARTKAARLTGPARLM